MYNFYLTCDILIYTRLNETFVTNPLTRYIAHFDADGSFIDVMEFPNTSMISNISKYDNLMTIDKHDNVIFTGEKSFEGGDFDPSSDTSILASSGVFICKLCQTPSLIIGDEYVTYCDSFTWINGVTYFESVDSVLYNIKGGSDKFCDSLTRLHLTLFHSTSSIQNLSACDSFTWINGETYNIGYFEDETSLLDINGCDSIITLHLTVLPSASSTQTLSACDNYTWIDGNSYNTNVVNQPFVLNQAASNGCDSTVYLNLTINQSYLQQTNVLLCQGESYSIGGNSYTTDVITTESLQSASGCDSTHITQVEFIIADSVFVDTIICQGSSLLFINDVYTESGVFQQSLSSVQGCDSIWYQIALTILPTSIFEQQATICQGEQFSVGNSVYTASNLYVDTLINYLGCDSIVYSAINVLDTTNYIENVSICIGDTLQFEEQLITESGIYTVSFLTLNGCDSTRTAIVTLIDDESCFTPTKIPNSFSPNGDNLNEVFQAITDPYLQVVSMKIFNRWGAVVYETHNNIGWDGQFENQELPSDLYFYFIEVLEPNGKVDIFRGELYLLR